MASVTALEVMVGVLATGIGATLVMDAWSGLQRCLGVPTLDYALLGRWAGYLGQRRDGRGAGSASIRDRMPLPYERSLGWTLHYLIGIVFAAGLIVIEGVAWLQQPAWQPALLWGLATVAAPFLVLQPAMGAGIAASRTAAPWKNRWRSLVTHAVFGAGLYVSAMALAWVRA